MRHRDCAVAQLFRAPVAHLVRRCKKAFEEGGFLNPFSIARIALRRMERFARYVA